MKFSHYALIGAALALVSLLACGPEHPKKRVFHANAKEYHLADGRYAMQTADNTWLYYYMFTNNVASEPYRNTTAGATTAPVGISGNAGTTGGWVRGSAPNNTELENAEIESVAVGTTPNGQVEAMTEAEVQMEPVEAGEIGLEPADSASSSSDSGSSSSGGGDSGGGGDD